MALVERLMNLETPRIPVHSFFAANHQRIDGVLTRQQVIDFFGMTGATVTEYDALAATAPTGSSTANLVAKALFIEKIHAIFILAEGRYAGYATAADVRAKLGL